jgi:hypothetical protein
MATLLERVLGTHRERQALNFRELVVEIADGIEPDPEVVARALYDSKKDRDDLQEAVELLKRRRQWRQQYDRLPELAAERAEVRRQIAAAEEVFEAAEKERFHVVEPLRGRDEEIGVVAWEGEKAGQELQNTCTDPVVLEQLSDVQMRLTNKREQAGDLRRQIDQLRELAKDDRAEAARQKMIVGGDRDVKAYLERAKQHDRKIAECEAAMAKVDKAISNLEHEEAAIRVQMLVP